MATAGEVRAGLAYIELTVRNKVRQGLSAATADFNRFISRLQRTGFGMMLGGGFLAAPMLSAVEHSADLEKTLALVKVTTDSVTGSMEILRDTVKKVAIDLPFTEAEVAKGALDLARSGLGRSEISSSLPGLAQFAMLADMPMNDAAQMLGRTAKAMNLDLGDLARVANVLAITANTTATNSQEVADAMTYIAGAARDANLGLEETAVLLQLITEGGGGFGSRAGAGLANALQTLRGKRDELKELFDIDIINADGLLADVTDIFRQLSEARKRIGTDAFMLASDEIFQKRDARIIRAIVASFDQYDERLKRMTTDTSYLEEATRDLNTNAGFLWERLKSIADSVRNSLGSALMSELPAAIDTIERAANMTIEWIRANQTLVSSIAKVTLAVVAVGTALWLAGMMLQVLSFGLAPLLTMATTIAGLATQFVVLAATNPFAMAVIGVSSLLLLISQLGGGIDRAMQTAAQLGVELNASAASFAAAMQSAWAAGNPDGFILAVTGGMRLMVMTVQSHIAQMVDDILNGIINAVSLLYTLNDLDYDAEDRAYVEWLRQTQSQERAARLHALDEERRALEWRVAKSNEEYANAKAATDAQRAATEAQARANREAEAARKAITRALQGFSTSGSFSGFLANKLPLFTQTKGVDEAQLDALRGIEDAIEEVADNTDALRGIRGLTFSGAV